MKGFGFVKLDEELKVKDYNKSFEHFTASAKKGTRITDIFPQLNVLNSIFEEVKEGTQSYFSIKNMSQSSKQSEFHFNITIFPTDSKKYTYYCLLTEMSSIPSEKKRADERSNELWLEADDDNIESFIDESIIGSSTLILNVKKAIKKISDYDELTILLEGESGTGKNLAAKVIHYSTSKKSAFIEINCAAIPEALLESELFGHKKGAFTNAMRDKTGLVEEADGGTLFLDEISAMPLSLQAKLLSFLESRKFRPVGSVEEKKVNIRLLTATNQNLEQLVKEGDFREDLYYRLNVFKIGMPPLRQMEEDIRELAENFMQLFAYKYDKDVTKLSDDAENLLKRHRWPGNVRELRNVIERAVILTENEEITEKEISIGSFDEKESPDLDDENITLPEEGISFSNLEKNILQEALRIAEGNQTRAAQLLQISRETFRYRVEKYNLR